LNDIETLIKKVKESLKPDGKFIGSTINKTFNSYFQAIFFAEKILNIVPEGTHSWKKFVKPNNLKKKLVILNIVFFFKKKSISSMIFLNLCAIML